jgi:hypothetical protein
MAQKLLRQLLAVQFVAGLGTGSASLVWHVSGWTLGSISGFSTAAARILQRSMAARQAGMCAIGHLACLLLHPKSISKCSRC